MQIPSAASRGTAAAVCCCLVLAIAAVYVQTLGHEFVNYDDDSYVYANATVRSGFTARASSRSSRTSTPTTGIR